MDHFLTALEADQLYEELLNLVKDRSYAPQTADGKIYNVNFGKLMFLDQNLIAENRFPEKAWGSTTAWTDQLKDTKTRIEQLTGTLFQTAVMIYYPNGESGVDFHSDYSAFGDTTIIPSLSLGEERVFLLREKSSRKVLSKVLQHGSLIIMGKNCQERYEHSLPFDTIYSKPRINVTFRKYGFDN